MDDAGDKRVTWLPKKIVRKSIRPNLHLLFFTWINKTFVLERKKEKNIQVAALVYMSSLFYVEKIKSKGKSADTKIGKSVKTQLFTKVSQVYSHLEAAKD